MSTLNVSASNIFSGNNSSNSNQSLQKKLQTYKRITNPKIPNIFKNNGTGSYGSYGSYAEIDNPYDSAIKEQDAKKENIVNISGDNQGLRKFVTEMTLAKDFTAYQDERGTIKLNVTNPDFVKHNRGYIFFVKDKDDNNYRTLETVHQLGGGIRKGSKSVVGKEITIPSGYIDASNEDAGSSVLTEYFKVKEFPTVVYMDENRNYHHFHGEKGIVNLVKFACEKSKAGICNMIDFGDYKHIRPTEPKPAHVGFNLKF